MINAPECVMSADELLAETRAVADWISDCLSDGTHESWTPHLRVLALDPLTGKRSDTLIAFAVPFNSDEEKRDALRDAGRAVFQSQKAPMGLVFSSEAWVTKNPKYSRGGGRRPEHDPRRNEVVIVAAQTLGMRQSCFTQMPILRRGGYIVPANFEPFNQDFQFPLGRHFWDGFFATVWPKVAREN